MNSNYGKEMSRWFWERSWTQLTPDQHRFELRQEATRAGIAARRDQAAQRHLRTEDGQAATHHPHQVDRRDKAFRYPVGV